MTSQESALIPEGEKGSILRYLWVGLAAAVSGVLTKLFQEHGNANVFVSTLIHTAIVLIPAVFTYYFLSREQEKRLAYVTTTLQEGDLLLKDLKRVIEIEKNYYSNEQLMRLERQVIDSTASSMQEIAELVAEYDDAITANVRLKERFKVHAKSIQTFHRAFALEIEGNLKIISRVKHEFEVIKPDERDDLLHDEAKSRSEKVFARQGISDIVATSAQLSFNSRSASEVKDLENFADKKTNEILGTISNNTEKRDGAQT